MCQGSTGPWERTIVGEKQDGSPHHQADSPYTPGIVGLRRAVPLSQVPANPSPPKPRECTESLLPGSLVIWLTPTLQDTRKTVPTTTTARHPCDPCTPTHCLPPVYLRPEGGTPLSLQWTPGPRWGLGSAPRVLFHRSRGGWDVQSSPGFSPALPASCSSEQPLTPMSLGSSGGSRSRRAGHIPSTLVASKNKKRNRVSGTSPFTSAQERRAPHVKAQRRRPPGAGRR